jgi:hypothetical protein
LTRKGSLETLDEAEPYDAAAVPYGTSMMVNGDTYNPIDFLAVMLQFGFADHFGIIKLSELTKTSKSTLSNGRRPLVNHRPFIIKAA